MTARAQTVAVASTQIIDHSEPSSLHSSQAVRFEAADQAADGGVGRRAARRVDVGEVEPAPDLVERGGDGRVKLFQLELSKTQKVRAERDGTGELLGTADEAQTRLTVHYPEMWRTGAGAPFAVVDSADSLAQVPAHSPTVAGVGLLAIVLAALWPSGEVNPVLEARSDSLEPRRILVADDDPDFRELLRRGPVEPGGVRARDDGLLAEPGDLGHRGGLLDDHLGEAAAVAQDQERHRREGAPAVDPALDADGRARRDGR